MRIFRLNPPSTYLNECFTYSPSTGELFWRERPIHHYKNHKAWATGNAANAGRLAGYLEHHSTSGRRHRVAVRITYKGKSHMYGVHRIAFSLMGIEIPIGMEVDHKDCNPFNNSWSNLRLATRAQNGANQKVHENRKHKHLPKGVSLKRKKFRSQIGWLGKQISLGSFSTPEEASLAYQSKAKELYGDFSRSN